MKSTEINIHRTVGWSRFICHLSICLLLLALAAVFDASPVRAEKAKDDPSARSEKAKNDPAARSEMVKDDPRCGRIDQRVGYGPFDYRQRYGKRRKNLGVVQKYHFTPQQQRDALRGRISKNIWKELDYVLRAFPNHAEALYLIGLYEHNLAKDSKGYYRKLKAREYYSPSQCYFQRAMRFAPKDPNVWTSLGRLHTQVGRHDEAIKAFTRAVKMAPRSASAHYNLGLAYYAAGRFDEARGSAKKAYSLGYSRKDLAKRLASKGHWE